MWASEACKKRAERSRSRDKAGTGHPLQAARAEQEATDLKSKLSQIIYNGIIDRLKYGPVHADDLEPLFPEECRDICRRLVGAQFGSLASRHYIRETERRKSTVRTRKGAKSGVYVLTTKGRARLVGHRTVGVGNGGPVSGEPAQSSAGVPEPQGPGGSTLPSCTGTEKSEGASGADHPDAPPEPLELLPPPDPEAWAA